MYLTTNKKSTEQGFTLIEVLVGINLSFIVLTILISVFLITYKFVYSSTKKFNDRENISMTISSIERLIQKRNNFSIRSGENNSQLIIFEPRDTIIISNKSIRVSDYFSLDDIDSVSLTVKKKNNAGLQPTEISGTASEIAEISLKFQKNKVNHEYKFAVPDISTRNFVDIDNEK